LWRSFAVVRHPYVRARVRRGAVAVDVDFEDSGVMGEAIHSGKRHGGVREDLSPSPERLICGDQGGSPFVSSADELEQEECFRLIFADIGEIIEDQQMKAIEPVDGGLQRQFAARHLKPFDQIGRAGEQHAPAVLD